MFAVVACRVLSWSRRLGIPGIIGLLIGGFRDRCPTASARSARATRPCPELGQLGPALPDVRGRPGARPRRCCRAPPRTAVLFGVLTFACRSSRARRVGFALGLGAAGALLLGSLLASHTLITYPIVRDAGRAADRPWPPWSGHRADRHVRAGRARRRGRHGDRLADPRRSCWRASCSASSCSRRRASGLPRVPARPAGGAATRVRYLVAVCRSWPPRSSPRCSGIEGIVGAFVAGLALNRLVPNEGPSMEPHRVLRLGGVHPGVPGVGRPAARPLGDVRARRRWGSQALIIVACMGGKALVGCSPRRPLLRLQRRPRPAPPSRSPAPQAAATLAATLVGYDIGLFGTDGRQRGARADPRQHHGVDVSLPNATWPSCRPRRVDLRGVLGRRVLLATRRGGPLPGVVATVRPAGPARPRRGGRGGGARRGRGRAAPGRGPGPGAAPVPRPPSTAASGPRSAPCCPRR